MVAKSTDKDKYGEINEKYCQTMLWTDIEFSWISQYLGSNSSEIKWQILRNSIMKLFCYCIKLLKYLQSTFMN